MTTSLFYNARIYTPVDNGEPSCGTDQGSLKYIEHGALLVKDGIIIDIGDETTVREKYGSDRIGREVDCLSQCLIPGFVDPHTHMCFAELREDEFALRIQGIPYLEILARGGGILSSVKSVAETKVKQLAQNTRRIMQRAMTYGTTTVEIKSGYGLDTENELKMLEAINLAAMSSPLDVVPTFLGAHAIPQVYKNRSDEFIGLIIEEMLPAVKKQGIANQCDVFCEKGVFSVEQGKRLLAAAKELGFGVKLHADEVHDLGGAGLAAELRALSADHLLAASEDNIVAMGEAGVVATLLPATAYSLRKPYAQARQMIKNNVSVALATDCNPGSSYTESMPFIIGLAVLNMHMSPAEALTAATLNAAYAIGMEKKVGSLDIGKQADFLLLEGKSPAILAYHAGASMVSEVYKRGERVASGYSSSKDEGRL